MVETELMTPEEVVQSIWILYTYITSSGGIRYDELSQTADCGSICSKLCSCEQPILQDMCILGGQGSTELSRLLLILPLVCENAYSDIPIANGTVSL